MNGARADSFSDVEAPSSGNKGLRPLMGASGPTLSIHLRFTNMGTERVELVVEDFASPLGNFAVQPEKLEIEAGQSVETEPMSSLLAADSLTETEVTLALRLSGNAEKKVLALRAVPAANGGVVTPADAPGATSGK
jgi:hypothetical protein